MKIMKYVLAVALALCFTATGKAQTNTFAGNGGRCNVKLTQNYSTSTLYQCTGVPVTLNGELTPTHQVGFSVIVANGGFTNGSFVLFDHSGSIVFVSSNFSGTAASDGSLTGSFSGTLPDAATFNGVATQTVGQQKVVTYRSVSYIWVVKSGNGSYTIN